MNILYVTEYFPDSNKANITGGVESRCYNVAKRLATDNKVSVLTSWRTGLRREDAFSRIKIYRVGPNHDYSNYGGFLSRLRFAIAAMSDFNRHRDADVIDGYNFTSYLPAYWIGRRIKKPVVATYHESWVNEWVKNKGLVTGVPYELYEHFLLKLKYDRFVCVSNFTRKKLVNIGIQYEKMVVVPNGVDIIDAGRIKGKKASKPTICFVGRLVETKKVDVLIKAMSIVKKELPEAKCIVIGQGKELNRLKQVAKDFEIGDSVDFLGFIEKNREVMKIIKSSAVFCLPSIVEGFGMVVIEAMALGVPYVCSDIEVLKEVTENGKGGLLFRQNNYHDLASQILILLKNNKIYEEKVAEERTLANKYSWDTIAQDTSKTYKDIIRSEKQDF